MGAAKDIPVQQGESIQAAVKSASSGDTIIVYPGNYYENIDISKANLELRSASGNPEDTIIASNATGKDVISLGARSNSKIKGFTISGATGATSSGISLNLCNGCTIENNKFLNNTIGVSLKSSGNIVVNNNTVTGGTGTGIYISQSYSTTTSGNQVSGYVSGIKIASSQNGNTVSGNTVSQNSGSGIALEDTNNNNTLENNIISSNGNIGIFLAGSSKNNLRNNIVSSSGGNGIELKEASGNTVSGNTVSGNTTTVNNHGIFLNNCTDSYVQSNTVTSCEYAIAMRYSNNNNVKNNDVHDNERGFYVAYTSSGNTLSGNKANLNSMNGITLFSGTNNNIVDGNEVNSNANNGIYLYENAYNNKIINNAASQNVRGIVIQGAGCVENTLSNNILNYNSADGVRLDNSSENNLINNTVISSSTYGICLVGSCSSNELKSNTAQLNKIGIYVMTSTGNTLSENTVFENGDKGILLSLANNNTLSRNKVHDNIVEGISLDSSESNNISGNNIISNGKGIYMCPKSFYNLVYNNCFNNPENADVRNNESHWNIEKTSGKNVMGGKTLGGNFWGIPSGEGFSDKHSDTNGDGIIDDGTVDIPYVSDNGNIIDNFPLVRVIIPVPSFGANPIQGFAPLTVYFTDHSQYATSIRWDFGDGTNYSTEQNPTHTYSAVGDYIVTLTASNKNDTVSTTQKIIAQKYTILPIANFNANPISGCAPLSVQFTDISQYGTSRNWDIGNDGTIESTNASFAYVFNNPGTYPVSLTAINENGTSLAKPVLITVTEESSSSGGSSGGSSHSSGGGGGGSPEPQTNVQVKELSKAQVTNGKPVMFDFTQNATCVVYVSFDAKKTAGKITTIAEQLKAKSTLVSVLDSGEVYKYFNLWVGNSGFATEKNIENPVVCFKVEKSWLQDKKIEQSSITLNRYNDKKWSQIPVKLLKEDSTYLYFTAETPGFSFFAITGKAVEKEKVAEIKPSTETSKPEQNNKASEINPEKKSQQETGKDKVSSIPGFEALYAVACLFMVLLHRRK